MARAYALVLFAGAILLLCRPASAAVIDTYADWDGNITDSYAKIAQNFLTPSDNRLLSWQLNLAPASGSASFLFEIVPWNTNSGPSGAPLITRTVSWPSSGGNVLIDNLNLTLTPGSRYAALIDLGSYRGPSVAFEKNQNSYSQGNAAWFGAGINPTWEYLNATWNTEFRAQFVAIPEPAGILPLAAAALAGMVLLRSRFRSVTLEVTSGDLA